MAEKKLPVTAATRWLKAARAVYSEHPYDYEERGGTSRSAQQLGVSEHHVIKTLMFVDERGGTFVVLMHGDFQVSARELARQAGVRTMEPCSPALAEKVSGYQVGGISPFAQRKSSPVFAEATVRDLEYLYVNGGRRGFLVGMTPAQLEQLLGPKWVEVKRPRKP